MGLGRGSGLSILSGSGSSVLAPSISYAGSPFAWEDEYEIDSASVSSTGGPVTSYAVHSGALPTGVSLDTSTGEISGWPTVVSSGSAVIRATGPGGTGDATVDWDVAAPVYSLDVASSVPPNLPFDAAKVSGTWVSDTDGARDRISTTTNNAIVTLALPAGGVGDAFTLAFTVKFGSGSRSDSYFFPYVRRQINSAQWRYEVVLSRGTNEVRGALWVQKDRGGLTDLGPTYVGVSGTTFAADDELLVSVAVSGTATTTFDVTVQRASDNQYLKPDGSWQVGSIVALSVSDSSSPITTPGSIGLEVYQSAQDAYLYAMSVVAEQTQFVRLQDTPVLVKGGSYDGWDADALAAPAVCWDGSRYVMTVSLWSIANAKWASAFFTSPDLVTWAYVSGSLRAPTGGDYILGNAGLVWWGGLYWFAYNHYGGTANIAIESSADLLTWTPVLDPVAVGADPEMSINPSSGDLELWYMDAGREVNMIHSADGSSWSSAVIYLADTQISFAKYNFGEPSVYYVGSERRILFDAAMYGAGYRATAVAYSPVPDTTNFCVGVVLRPKASNAWEAGQVFDSTVIVTDRGDGRGSIPWILYAGSDGHSGTDDTNSSIGLAGLGIAP